MPRRDELALQVVAARGRVGAVVLDRLDGVGSAELTQDWLPAQAEPATSNLLLGLAPAPGRRTLVIANGGDDEVRAERQGRQRTGRCSRPRGCPRSGSPRTASQRVALSSVLGEAIADGAIGLLVDVDRPGHRDAALLRRATTSRTPYPRPVEESATALLPRGPSAARVRKTVELAGADPAGVVTVVVPVGVGEELADRDRGRGPTRPRVTVRLPADAGPGDGHRRAHLGRRRRC